MTASESSKHGSSWKHSRWMGIKRPYTRNDVARLRGSLRIEYTLAQKGAERFWELLQTRPYVAALGAVTGDQAVEQVRAGLMAIYADGSPIAADSRAARDYSDPNLPSPDNIPNLVRSINRSLRRADQIHYGEGNNDTHWFAPIFGDAEAGLGGSLNGFEMMKAMIEAGAAGVHFEDQLSTERTRGSRGGKILVTTSEFIEKLIAARLAADVMNVPTVLIACTHANTERVIRCNRDSRDREFATEEMTPDGHFIFRGGLDAAIARGLAYAPYADLLWYETAAPDLKEAQKFAEAIHAQFPGKLLAYNCCSSFHWMRVLDATTIRNFQVALSGMGYKLQFIPLAGFHALNWSMFDLARGYRETGMAAYARLQQNELELAQSYGYETAKYSRFANTGYLHEIVKTISDGTSSTMYRDTPTDDPASNQKCSVPSRP